MRDLSLILLTKKAGGLIEMTLDELAEAARDTAVATMIHNGKVTLTTVVVGKEGKA